MAIKRPSRFLFLTIISLAAISCQDERAPSIVSVPVTEAHVGRIYTYQVHIQEEFSCVYSLVTAPPGMAIDSTTGLITWTPCETSDFTAKVEVDAKNGQRNCSQCFSVRVGGLQAEGWETDVLSNAHMKEKALNDMLDFIKANPRFPIHCVLIIRNGKLVFEEYFPGMNLFWPPWSTTPKYVRFDRYSPHQQASIMKSVVSLLMGIAIRQGVISDVEQPCLAFFPEYGPFANWSSEKRQITLENLLTMSSGLSYGEPEWDGFLNVVVPTHDWLKTTLDLPVITPPGKTWAYFTAGPHLVGAAIANAARMPLDEFAGRYLLKPLEMEGVQWAYDPMGRVFGGGGHQMRPIDMVKIGYLLLNRGMWKGREIISPDWIPESTAVRFRPEAGEGYGYFWWRPTFRVGGQEFTPYEAGGGGGQFIFAFPELDMVVAMTGGDWEDTMISEFGSMMTEYILPSAVYE
jgi:hypothetical protein